MNKKEFIDAVEANDMETIFNEWKELLESVQDEDYDKDQERNIDLSVLSHWVWFNAVTLTPEKSAVVLKETIVGAYLLGRRDEKMSTFVDALNEEKQ